MSVACEVCYEFYSEYPQSRLPRALPCCGHDFCTGCIASLCETERLPVCPKCRTPLFQNRRQGETPAIDETTQTRQADVGGDVDEGAHRREPAEVPASSIQKQHCNEHQDRYMEWPVLRCLLQLDERIDFSPHMNTLPSGQMNVLQRALQAAPMTALQMELNGRMQREIIDAITTDELQKELAKRQHSTPPVPPCDPSPCQSIKQQSGAFLDMPVHSAPSVCSTFTTSCSLCRCRTQARRRCCAAEQRCCCARGCSSGNYYAHDVPEWPPSPFLPNPHSAPSQRYCPIILQPTCPLEAATAYMETCPLSQYNVPHHYCCQVRPRRPFDIILRHLFTVYVLLWHICMGCLGAVGAAVVKLFALFKNIRREQRLQLIMIANALPLLIGSFYVFHNPTFFIQIRSPL